MSEENVATVRASLEHFASTDEFLNVLAPDFVWDMRTYDEALQAAGLSR